MCSTMDPTGSSRQNQTVAFPIFGKLPKELRFLVYEHAFPRRVLRFHLQLHYGNHVTMVDPLGPPPIAQTCREAWMFASVQYRKFKYHPTLFKLSRWSGGSAVENPPLPPPQSAFTTTPVHLVPPGRRRALRQPLPAQQPHHRGQPFAGPAPGRLEPPSDGGQSGVREYHPRAAAVRDASRDGSGAVVGQHEQVLSHRLLQLRGRVRVPQAAHHPGRRAADPVDVVPGAADLAGAPRGPSAFLTRTRATSGRRCRPSSAA
ncbi:hypothetical protein M426DRAFT_97038 [Hypoxylon sp. CI-4A]|nr:hypothetical protein M426DRAFT_97038 [Hypoxylon sp. CI-4A]